MDNVTRLGRRKAQLIGAPHETAAQAIGRLEPGCRILGFTKGQFSMLDIIRAALDQTGPAHVTVMTWTVSVRDALNARILLDRRAILSFRLLLDWSFASRHPNWCRAVLDAFGPEAIRCTLNHAKVALIENDTWHIALRGSMNLTTNPCYEQFDIDDDPAICAFVREHLEILSDAMPPGLTPSHDEVVAGFRAGLGDRMSDEYRIKDAPEAEDLDLDALARAFE